MTTEGTTPRPRPASADSERGATLIIFMLVIVVLMGFAAFAVDVAAALAQRRQNQAAVDLGALAGLQFMVDRSRAAAVGDAEQEIMRLTHASINVDVTPDAWADAWRTCIDATKPVEFSVTATSDCVSFTPNLERLRVRLPTIAVETSFGRILGRDVIETTAVATVGLAVPSGGAVLPFALAAGDGGSHVCLKTGANPKTIDPCDGGDTGNFGFLDITQFGSVAAGTVQSCTGDTTDRLASNVAGGVDHPLGTAPSSGAPSHDDRTACLAQTYGARPYTVVTETGNGKGDALHAGFVAGVDGRPGRLTASDGTATVAGYAIDDTPLWDHLSTDGRAFCGAVANHDDLASCMDGWSVGDPVLFDGSVGDAARFAWVPTLWSESLGNGSSDHHLKGFEAVYVQTTLWSCTAASCSAVHDPGEPLAGSAPGRGSLKLDAASAFRLRPGMLPDELADRGPAAGATTAFTLVS